MDAIYLYNKYGKPISWDTWVSVRKMLGTYGPFLSLCFAPICPCILMTQPATVQA